MPNTSTPPPFTTENAQDLALEHFKIKPLSIKELPSYEDRNFHLKTTDGKQFILKIMVLGTELEKIELEHLVMLQLNATAYNLQFPQPVPNQQGTDITHLTASNGQIYFMRLLTWVEGRMMANIQPCPPELLVKLGETCGRICWELQGLDHPNAHRKFDWDNSQAIWTKEKTGIFEDIEKRTLVKYFIELYESQALPFLDNLPKSIVHNDLNDFNVVVKNDGENLAIAGVIDFGDVVYTNTINELAICIAYNCMNQENPLEAVCHILKGCQSVFPFTDSEIKVLFPLIAIRLVVSVTTSTLTLIQTPENKEYLLAHQEPAWRLLKQWSKISPNVAYDVFRKMCT